MAKPVCLIVGYGPGVGHGVAVAFATAGYDLVVASRDPAKHASSLAVLERQGVRALSIAIDAADTASLSKAISLASETSPVEVLVYNAVSPTFVQPTLLAPEQLAKDFRVNVVGALAATQAVLPGMHSRGKGRVLFTGGGWAYYPWDQAASPSIGKAGLRSLALTLGQELKGSPVRVGLVSIMGEVAAGTPFDPTMIGAAFLDMAQRSDDGYETEVMFTGK
jgi:short-subunit dehydrogenase